ncbi:MAG: hypothetical protein GC201_08880 [Alphaproteobacteria bacterium]|nr:hypothetical protein [Alphaproteobacteria bacterium]
MQQTPGTTGVAPTDLTATRQAQSVARQVQAKLNASRPDVAEMAKAARSKNVDAAKQILLRNGYKPEQLAGASIAFNDLTGGGPVSAEQRFEITIDASCCPLRIVITIKL